MAASEVHQALRAVPGHECQIHIGRLARRGRLAAKVVEMAVHEGQPDAPEPFLGGGERPHEDRAVAADHQWFPSFVQDGRDCGVDLRRSPADLLETDYASARVAVRVIDRGVDVAGVTRAGPLCEPCVP